MSLDQQAGSAREQRTAPWQTVPGYDHEQERIARAALSGLFEPGDLRVGVPLSQVGAVRTLRAVTGDSAANTLRSEVAARLAGLDPLRDLELAEKIGVRFLIPGDAEWPTQIDDLDLAEPVDKVGTAPIGLWVRGPLRLDTLARSIAVVGSRDSTTYGDEISSQLAASIGRAGRPVVSGGAFGIDYAAHRGALAAGAPTVAVLACGVDRPYPAAHKALLDRLADHGALVAEVPPGWAPLRPRFLSRNRVIASLTQGTVVVEAALRSGALNTANWASRLNRVLMGVPGPVTSATSEGVHEQVRRGAAALVTRGEEVLELVGGAGVDLLDTPRGPERARDNLTKRQRQVLEAVPIGNGATAESVARVAGLGFLETSSTLATLESMGLTAHDQYGWRLAGAARR